MIGSEAFTYDGNTGWMTEDVTPFKSSTWSAGSEASQVVRYETYAAADSGGGMGADSTFLVERPRTVTTKVLGVVTAETFNRFGNSYDASGNRKDAAGNFMTRQATAAGGSWANAGLWSNTQINAFDAVNVASAAGAIVTNKNFNSGTLNTTYSRSGSWFGTPVSQSQSVRNPFGNPFSGNSAAVGRRYDASSTTSQDSYDRVKKETLSGGLGDAATYITGSDWLGPSTVTETDGSKTKYTYTVLGQVATKVIYSGLSNSVKYAYTYDAAGNVVQKTTTAVDTSGNPVGGLPVVTNTYTYDALGRLTKEVDDSGGTDSNTANRTTTDAYTLSNNQNVITATYPGGTTRVENDYLDGTPASVSGTAVTPATYDEGGIATAGTDANGNADSNVLAGSRWSKTISGGSANTTISYANLLGEQYLTQQSAPSATSSVTGSSLGWKDATASFDGNGRQSSSTDVDGSITLTQYDPTTSQPAATVQDVDQDNAYTAGTDRKTIVNMTPLAASDTTPGGSDSQGLYAAANTDDNATTWNGGLNSSQTINGQTTSAQVSSPAQGGYTNTITNPDGTQIVDTYTSGLLTQEQKLGTDGASVIWTKTWNYDGLRRLSSYVDYTGTTTYGYFEDGTQKSVTLPGHSVAQTVNTLDQPTEAPTQITRPDNSSVSQPLNNLALAASDSGAGTIPARLGYDTAGTGAVTSLETYAGAGLGTLGTAGAGSTTSWGYDQATGQLASKTYADYSLSNPDQIKYQYNAAMQLAKVTEPGITTTSFGYNGAGEQTSFSYNDSVTGVVSSSITSLDELGRLKTVSDTDNSNTFTTTTAYTNLNQLFSEQYASAGGAGTQHVYFPTTGFGSTGAPGALQTLTVTPAPGSGAPTVQTTYSYDVTSKRLNQISVNGINFGISYLANSDQVNRISAGNVVTAYTPDSTDGARLGELKTTANGTTVLDEKVTAYTPNDQRQTETVSRVNPGSPTPESHSTTYGYNSQDELTSATDYMGGGNYSCTFDNAGNRTGTSLGLIQA